MTSMRILTTALLLAFAGAASAANGVTALKTFYDRVDSLHADFHQTQVDEQGEIVQEASGIFLLQRPERFRWEYDSPYKQIIVSDGKAFRFYDVDLEQVTIRDVDQTLRATPALLLTGGVELDKEFKIAAAGEHDGLAWVRLLPRAEDSDFKEVRLGLDNGVPHRMELDDHLGQTTRIAFSDIRVNQAIKSQRFTLSVPDDVEVVDARAGTKR